MPNFFIAIISALAIQTYAACTREVLKAVTDELFAAQTAGQTNFNSLSSTVAYTENRKSVDIKTGILSKSMKIDHARSQHDTTQCAAFSEFIVTDTAAPYVIATQLRLDNSTKVSQIDTIWTSKGDWLFNVTGTYYWATHESVKVPWGSPCARLEGGAYTGKGEATDRCDVGVPSGVPLVNRQYVIDEEYGTVDIIMDFGGVQGQVGADGLPDSHEFRVEGGKLRYVHTLSSCGGKACM